MIVRRVLVSPLILFAAVIGQLVVVNRMPLPGHGGLPDLVLLVVAALGVSAGPMTGLLAGFAGGLALDVAPPGGHLAGEYALVYCLTGYACGRVRDSVQGGNAERSVVTSLTVMAAGVAAGEAGKAALGMMLSDPNMTGPAVRHVLPAAVIYDLLLCPFVLWLVSAAVGGHPVPEHAPQTQFLTWPRLAPAFRAASAGAVPRLRLAGSTPLPVPPPARQEPSLRLASSRSSLSPRTSGASSSAQPALAGSRAVRLNFASGGASALRPTRLASFQAKSPGKGWLRAGRPASGLAPQAPQALRQARTPAKGFARHATAPVRGGGVRRGRPPGKSLPGMTPRRGRSPGKGWIRAGGPTPPATWPLGRPRRLTGAPGRIGSTARQARSLVASPAQGTPIPQLSSPRKGWLRPAAPPAAPRLAKPGKGWLRPARPPAAPRLAKPGRGWLRPAKPPRQNWYTRSRSTRWLRRGRRRRLLLGGRR